MTPLEERHSHLQDFDPGAEFLDTDSEKHCSKRAHSRPQCAEGRELLLTVLGDARVGGN